MRQLFGFSARGDVHCGGSCVAALFILGTVPLVGIDGLAFARPSLLDGSNLGLSSIGVFVC